MTYWSYVEYHRTTYVTKLNLHFNSSSIGLQKDSAMQISAFIGLSWYAMTTIGALRLCSSLYLVSVWITSELINMLNVYSKLPMTYSWCLMFFFKNVGYVINGGRAENITKFNKEYLWNQWIDFATPLDVEYLQELYYSRFFENLFIKFIYLLKVSLLIYVSLLITSLLHL